MDLIIREFKNKLVADINEAKLPMEVKRLVLAEIMTEVCDITEKLIQEQNKKEAEQKEEEE